MEKVGVSAAAAGASLAVRQRIVGPPAVLAVSHGRDRLDPKLRASQ